MSRYYKIYNTETNTVVRQLTLPDDADPALQLNSGEHYEEGKAESPAEGLFIMPSRRRAAG